MLSKLFVFSNSWALESLGNFLDSFIFNGIFCLLYILIIILINAMYIGVHIYFLINDFVFWRYMPRGDIVISYRSSIPSSWINFYIIFYKA